MRGRGGRGAVGHGGGRCGTAGDEAVVLRRRGLLTRRGAAPHGGSAPRLELAGEEREDDEEEGDGARHERAPRRARRHAANVRAEVEKRLRSPPTLSELSVTVPMLLP